MNTDMKSVIEAALFASQDPLTLDKIKMLFPEHDCPSKEELLSLIEELKSDYADRGVDLVDVASGYRFQSSAKYTEFLQRLWQRKPPRYSRALFETLALVAYKQPLTRGEIEEVRGVAVSSHIVKTLMDRGWVRAVGYRDVPGRPALLATTKSFLDYFNLKKLTDLPPLSKLMNFDELEKQLGFELPKGVDFEVNDSETVEAEVPGAEITQEVESSEEPPECVNDEGVSADNQGRLSQYDQDDDGTAQLLQEAANSEADELSDSTPLNEQCQNKQPKEEVLELEEMV
jgi:segregation and condensation protein B